MAFIVEREFEHVGYKCVVIFGDTGYRCGYVGVPKEHPLYGKNYSDHLNIDKEELDGMELGKRGVMSLMAYACNDSDNVPLEIYFDVHGSLTYAGGQNSKYPIESDLWWFGFDCIHAGDGKDLGLAYKVFPESRKSIAVSMEAERKFPILGGEVRTCEYVENECKRLAEQLKEFETIDYERY